MFNNPLLLMAKSSSLKKERNASLTVGQGSGYNFVRGGRVYPLAFYGFSSGELPISLLSSETPASIVISANPVNVFGSAPELEKLGIKALFSTSPVLGGQDYTWMYISKDSPIWETDYEGIKLYRSDIELVSGEMAPEDDGYLGGEAAKGDEVLYKIDPYWIFSPTSGDDLEERAFINAEDLNKTVPLFVKLLTRAELGLNV